MEALHLPSELKKRVWSVLPRPLSGAAPVLVRRAGSSGVDEEQDSEHAAVDPWALLEHVPQLPSDEVVAPLMEKAPRRSRRVYRCAS